MLISEYIRNHKKNEAQVRYNQSGYIGQSMSVRAKQAYDSGEMPKSKWTKSAIIDELENMFGEEEAAGFKKFSRQALFDGVCSYSSWHQSEIEQINHRGNNAYRFGFIMPNNYTTMFHAYEEDLDELESLYNDLKNMKQNKITENIYKHICETTSYSIMDGYDDWKKNEYGLKIGDGDIWKDWNIKQLPLYVSKEVEEALS